MKAVEAAGIKLFPTAVAYRFWDECHDMYRKCCGEWNHTDKEGTFHPKGGDGSYPSEEEAKAGGFTPTWVEYGIRFTTSGAVCYYIYDSDKAGYSYGEDYSDPISYDAPDFWERVSDTMDEAPKAAWGNDVCSCPVCGDNYMAAHGACCELDEDNGGEEDGPSEPVSPGGWSDYNPIDTEAMDRYVCDARNLPYVSITRLDSYPVQNQANSLEWEGYAAWEVRYSLSPKNGRGCHTDGFALVIVSWEDIPTIIGPKPQVMYSVWSIVVDGDDSVGLPYHPQQGEMLHQTIHPGEALSKALGAAYAEATSEWLHWLMYAAAGMTH